jgi:hypothetical protein
MKAILLLLALAFQSQQLVEPPELLADTLRRRPELAVLNPERHIQGGYTISELRGFGHWPPWIVADLDRDGRLDVAAAVVTGDAEHRMFGALAIHSRQPLRIHWIEPLSPEPLYGMANGVPKDIVVPLHCVECDANSWYRWSGRSYAVALYRPGEQITLATSERNGRLGVFERASRASKMLLEVPSCSDATVLKVEGEEYQARWYLVELNGPVRTRGWVPASFSDEDECIG